MLRSGLALAGANVTVKQGMSVEGVEDGVVSAYEISGLNLMGTDLVVLSACETGVGDVEIGEGVFGLRRAFIQAGASRCLLVYGVWRISPQPC